MNMKKRMIIVLIVINMLFLWPVYPQAYEMQAPAGYVKSAETGSLVLYFNRNEYTLCVEDKRNGYLWYAAVSSVSSGAEGTNEVNIKKMKSLLQVSYVTNSRPYLENITKAGSLPDDVKVVPGLSREGISLAYYYYKIGLKFTVEIVLKEDFLDIRIPMEKIEENNDFRLVSIEIMPMLGASKDDDKGYLFYPDGSGALMKFKENSQYAFELPVFGTDKVDIDNYKVLDKQGIKQAMLPVFGVSRESNAFLAVITKGEYDATINIYQSGSDINLNRINSKFIYRRSYTDPRLKDDKRGVIEKEIIGSDRSLRYFFLQGNEADYSGMANVYREYLIKNGLINKSIGKKDGIPLGIDFLIGVKQKRILFDKYIPMTTFRQASEILGVLLKQGAGRIQVGLQGWQGEGYGAYPDHSSSPGKAGGTIGLRELSEFARENRLLLFLQDNYVDVSGDYGGFSKRRDVVCQRNGFVVTDLLKKLFILNPVIAFGKYTGSIMKDYRSYNIDGIKFEKFGRVVYTDYQKENPVTRQETAAYWERFMEMSIKELGHVAVDGGNAYVLKNADRLYKVPVSDSGYLFSDESVPFYQMVVHGLIPYSSDPGNLFYDFSRQKLQWVEYGYMPYFLLTYATSSLFQHTQAEELYSTEYRDWFGIASETYREFDSRLGNTWNQYMTGHEKLDEGFYMVTYSDKTRIYVNYNDKAVYAGGHIVRPMDYLVIDGGGNEK